MAERKGFDPSRHLMNLKGKEYLEVRWRIAWLREDHPDAIIETDMVRLDVEDGFALCRAHVEIPGGGSASGYGSETRKDFGDFPEKSETKALGRALAALATARSSARTMTSPIRTARPTWWIAPWRGQGPCRPRPLRHPGARRAGHRQPRTPWGLT